jgi:hypothetical protein
VNGAGFASVVVFVMDSGEHGILGDAIAFSQDVPVLPYPLIPPNTDGGPGFRESLGDVSRVVSSLICGVPYACFM